MESHSEVVRPSPRDRQRNRLRLVRRQAARAQPVGTSPHVEVLRAGARAWNAWRRENPGIAPVLNDLDVSVTERQFGRVQGGPIHLSRAELRGARLDQATLIEANLMGAVLTEADLSDARLEHADLRGARLAYAALDRACLKGANLCGTDLRLAQGLTQAQIDQAVGDHRTGLPAHLSMPRTWLQQSQPNGHAHESPAGERPGAADPARRHPRNRERQAADAPAVSRFLIAVALAGAIGVGVLTTMMDARLERRGVAPGEAPSAAREMVQDRGSQTPPTAPYAPSG
jgi:Pentapeptide repeats (8 copies)